MKGFVCKVCAFIAIDGKTPERCPVCGAPKSAFSEDKNAIKIPEDPDHSNELEKKHLPLIIVEKRCSQVPESRCQLVYAKIGEIQHPMQMDHYIMQIDFYIDKKFISRVKLTSEKLNPVAALHLKDQKGSVTVIARCNLHGAWMRETAIS